MIIFLMYFIPMIVLFGTVIYIASLTSYERLNLPAGGSGEMAVLTILAFIPIVNLTLALCILLTFLYEKIFKDAR